MVDAAIVDVVAMLGTLVQGIRANGQIDGTQPSPFYDSPFYDAYVCADGRLITKLGPQPPRAITATSATEFRVDGVDARVVFHEKDGKVTHLTIDQGGRQTDAQRVGD